MQQSVLKRGNPLLNKVCELVTDINEVQTVILNMMDTLNHIATLYDFRRGHGIAAPKIGYLKRINIRAI